MQVIVKLHRDAGPSYAVWQARLAEPPLGSKELVQIHMAELVAELERTEGEPVGASEDRSIQPSVWRWRYSSDVTIRYLIRNEPPRWFGPRVRRVIILEIEGNGPR